MVFRGGSQRRFLAGNRQAKDFADIRILEELDRSGFIDKKAMSMTTSFTDQNTITSHEHVLILYPYPSSFCSPQNSAHAQSPSRIRGWSHPDRLTPNRSPLTVHASCLPSLPVAVACCPLPIAHKILVTNPRNPVNYGQFWPDTVVESDPERPKIILTFHRLERTARV